MDVQEYSIDRIYDLLLWDSTCSEAEFDAREAEGIAAAMEMKNLFPFLQPIIVPAHKSKGVWIGCAKILAKRTDDELEPFFHSLLKWLQDQNWPGYDLIFDRLVQVPFDRLKSALEFARRIAVDANDQFWLENLDDLQAEMCE